MPNQVFDLGGSASLPSEFLVDTNLLVTQFVPNVLAPTDPVRQGRTASVFAAGMTGTVQVFAAPRSVDELYHVYLRAWYTAELKTHRSAYQGALMQKYGAKGAKKAGWIQLLKIRPSLVRKVCKDLVIINQAILATNVYIIQPTELFWPLGPASWEDTLVRLMGRYQMDSADSHIVLEAQRASISNIVTLDKDMRRAKADVDVYTWL